MLRFFSVFGEICRKTILIMGAISLLTLSSLFMFDTQPSFAGVSLERQPNVPSGVEKLGQDYQRNTSRSEAYEKAVNVADDPNGMEKAYEKNLENYKEEHPNDEGLVEKAKDLVEKVTGND